MTTPTAEQVSALLAACERHGIDVGDARGLLAYPAAREILADLATRLAADSAMLAIVRHFWNACYREFGRSRAADFAELAADGDLPAITQALNAMEASNV